jgi:hypothetical protein
LTRYVWMAEIARPTAVMAHPEIAIASIIRSPHLAV